MLDIQLLSVAKGKTRKIVYETLYLSTNGKNKLKLTTDQLGLRLIQLIRDEAHLFAIFGHKAKRAKKMYYSCLDKIPGIGFNRSQQLLRYFGGVKEVGEASKEEIAKVTGISKILAERIYDALHKRN